MSKHSVEVDSFIVYFTYVVIATTLLSCILIYAMRLIRIKSYASHESDGRAPAGSRGGRPAFDSTLIADDASSKSGQSSRHSGGSGGSNHSKNSGGGGAAGGGGGGVSSMRIQKSSGGSGKNRGTGSGRSGSKNNHNHSSISSAGVESKGDCDDDNLSQYSSSTNSLLIGEAKHDSRTEAMSEHMNHTMRMAFASVLSDGITLVQHSGGKSPAEVKLTLTGRDLQLRTRRFFGTQKPLSVDLKDVLFIEWGKRTQNLSSDATKDVRDEVCFSLVTEDSTLDFQASSKVERDALVQGFMLKVADLKDVGAKA